MSKDELKKQWIKRISEFDGNNESRNSFCEKRGISIKSFGYWYARYGIKSKSSKKIKDSKLNTQKSSVKLEKQQSTQDIQKSPEWIEIKIDTPIKNQHENKVISSSIIIKIGKAEIIVQECFNKNLLFDVSKILGEIC